MAVQGGSWAAQGAQPVFDGENYDYWCIKMKTLLISQDLWDIVDEGFEIKQKEVVTGVDRN